MKKLNLSGHVAAAIAGTVLSLVSIRTVFAADSYYYPPANRTEPQQKQDRYECHEWAVAQSHFDPVEFAARAPASQAPANTPAPPQDDSQAGKAMIGGAAMGAAVGEVANNDAGNGAIAGGAAGLLRGKMAEKKAAAEKAAAQQTAMAQAGQAQAKQSQDARAGRDAYQRARNTCFKARGYTVSEG